MREYAIGSGRRNAEEDWTRAGVRIRCGFDDAGRPTGVDVLDARELTLHITDEQSRDLAQGLEVSVFTVRGRIETAWKIQGGRFHLDVTVPVHATARVWLPTENAPAVTEGGREHGAAIRERRSLCAAETSEGQAGSGRTEAHRRDESCSVRLNSSEGRVQGLGSRDCDHD